MFFKGLPLCMSDANENFPSSVLASSLTIRTGVEKRLMKCASCPIKEEFVFTAVYSLTVFLTMCVLSRLPGRAELEKGSGSAHISQLPVEVLLKLFRYLGPEDLCRCGQVSTTWSNVAKTGSLWKHLYPVRWARGKKSDLFLCCLLTFNIKIQS